VAEKFIIQAKRYTLPVDVAAVRDTAVTRLMSAKQE
jgi:hypothetical protein